MKVCFLNGNPDPQNREFEAYLTGLSAGLAEKQAEVEILNLRDLRMSYCIGCFGCWVKTPGECVSRDDSSQVCRAVIGSDFIVWAAPLCMGFPSALLKKAMDKSIPIILPYFVVDHNEAHHRARYSHYPRLGLLVQKEVDTGQADLDRIANIFGRTALNMKSRLEFLYTTGETPEDVVGAILSQKRVPDRYTQTPLTPTQGTPITPPQRLTLFNGSPRGRKGNTPILLERFAEGFAALPGRSHEMVHLNRLNSLEQSAEAYARAECAWLGFPLYTDAMPGMVKAFIEALEPYRGRANNPPLGFLVQSGFPEAAHSRAVERYLEALAHRLGSPYLGTIVKGGAEGVRLVPEKMNRKLFAGLRSLGQEFAQTGRLNPAILKEIARPERFPAWLSPLFRVFVRLPLANTYWDMLLKQNGAFERRFYAPYS